MSKQYKAAIVGCGSIGQAHMQGYERIDNIDVVAVADPLGLSELLNAVSNIKRVHFQSRRVDKEARPDELIMLPVVAQDVTDVLAKKALNALPKFLNPIHIALLHPPGSVVSIGWPRRERLDSLLDSNIP